MAAGDVSVVVVENATTTSVDTQVTNLRVTANDKWNIFSMGSSVWIVHIEEV